MRCPSVPSLFSLVLLGGCVPRVGMQPSSGAHTTGDTARHDAIHVVGTWGGLLSQPAIELDHGVRIRLGIEATEIPRGGGTFVYCLAEKFDPNGTRVELPGTEEMGPVHIAIANEGESFPDTKLLLLDPRLGPRQEEPTWTILFLHPVIPKSDAMCRVRIYDDTGDVMAEAAVRVTKTPYHRWVPIWNVTPGVVRRDERGIYYGTLGPQEGLGIPIPRGTAFDWTRAIPLRGPAESGKSPWSSDSPLPQLDPRAPTFRLSMNGQELSLSAEHPFEFQTFKEHERLLSRWWVNNKPFVPSRQLTQELQAVFGDVKITKELRFRLELDPEAIGAKKGDKIGLQLRYAPEAVQWPVRGLELMWLDEKYLDQQLSCPTLPIVSNRVDFTAK